MELIWYIVIFSSIITVLIAILFLIEKKFKKELITKKKSPKRVYGKKLEKLRKDNKSYKEKFSELSIIAGEYFRNKLKIDSNSGFSEFAKKFKKEGKDIERKFCNLMIKLHYGKVSPSKKEIDYLLNLLENIIKGKTNDNIKAGEKWRGSINKIKQLRGKLEKTILKNRKEILNLAGIKIDSKERLQKLLSMHREEYKNLLSLNSKIKNIHKKLFSIFKEIYQKADKKQKKELNNFLIEWKKEPVEEKNPFAQQIILLRKLKKYSSKLEIILSFRF